MVGSYTDTLLIREKSSLVPLFEEAFGPLMEVMGCIFINDPDSLEHSNNKPLQTPNIPFLIHPHDMSPPQHVARKSVQ